MRPEDRLERAQEAQVRLAAIVNSSVDAIISKTLKGVITSWNPGAVNLFGYTADEAIGQSMLMLFPPDRASEEEEILVRIGRGEVVKSFETVRIRKDGKQIDVSVTISPIVDVSGTIIGASKIARDITERKRTEDALRVSEERYRTTLDNMLEGCQLIGFDWRYLYLNAAAARHNRRPNEELLGREMTEMWPGIEKTGIFARLRRCMEERIPHQEETEFIFPDGSSGWFDLRSQPVREGIFVLSVDITERRKAEEGLRHLNSELEQRVIARTAQLNSANEELESFSYSISHDLRAPLRAVNGFANMLGQHLSNQMSPEVQRALLRIQENSARMGQLIDGLLVFASLGREEIKKQPVNLSALAREALEELRGEFAGRRVEVEMEELPACQGDNMLLHQVYANLLSNALKYSRGRDPAIIKVGCRKEKGENVYYVQDNGAGFDMEYSAKLFHVFQRLHSIEEFDGTGVGLAIVHRIVTRHGGRIWAEGKVDHGATIYFTLEESRHV